MQDLKNKQDPRDRRRKQGPAQVSTNVQRASREGGSARCPSRAAIAIHDRDQPIRTGTGGAGVLGRKLVFVVDAGVLGRLRIFCHQCRFELIVAASAAIPGSKVDVSLVLPATLALPTLLSTDRRPSPCAGSDESLSSNDCGDRVFARSDGDVGGA